ncbi:hypothetical protein FOZ61_009219 [Perkinsus olseni]|uniref:Uncharacterized protein n=1 Tax=Perkinsus olseni TaxID=32597 RepID=A0A7J6M5G4_PEROL|nr:hypothetical protein FOZ61_009219 [Perkinsus olseni]
MSNVLARFAGRPRKTMLLSPSIARTDIPWPMRTDLGGHDPASPMAELMINTHSTFFPIAIFIYLSAIASIAAGYVNMTFTPPPAGSKPSAEIADLARITSVSSLMSNAVARATGRPGRNLLLSPSVVLADTPWPMRTDWGGHDPATPFAELMINTHSMFWPVAIFIFLSATYMVKK